MFFVINKFITDVVSALNGGVVFGDNITGVEKSLEFTYVSSSSFPVGFKWTLSTKPKALTVVSSLEDGSPFISAHAWEYTDTGLVNLTNVLKLTAGASPANLTANSRYKLLVRVTP